MQEITHQPQRRRRRGFRRRKGFTLVEILVAVLLLSGSLAAIMGLWSVSRRITERSRDTAEYYAVARQEAEFFRRKKYGFYGLFNSAASPYYNATTGVSTPRYADYDEDGNVLATDLPADASPTPLAYYRAKSTFQLAATGTETTGQDKLGIQAIEIFPITGHAGTPLTGTAVGATSVYQTTMFFMVAGV